MRRTIHVVAVAWTRPCAGGGWDQFVFSRLVYTGSISATAHVTDDGPVANLCSNLDVRVGDASRVVDEHGRAYAVVHQYDRYEAVAEGVLGRYPWL